MSVDDQLRAMRDEAARGPVTTRTENAFWRAATAALLAAFQRRGYVKAEADDLVQVSLIVVHRKLAKFEPDGPRGFSAWLKEIARLQAIASCIERLTTPYRETVIRIDWRGILVHEQRHQGWSRAVFAEGHLSAEFGTSTSPQRRGFGCERSSRASRISHALPNLDPGRCRCHRGSCRVR